LQLVLNGQLQTATLPAATTVQADAQGRWQAQVDTSHLADERQAQQLVVWWADGPPGQQASAARSFRLARQWQLVVDTTDPAGDDHGRDGRNTYPTDPSWGALRQMDLRGLRVWRAGGALRLQLQMHRTSRSWNPQNGFDHVAFTVFLGEGSGSDGSPPAGLQAMPLQDGLLPEGMRWQYRLRVHGWSNAWFSHQGASEQHEGAPSAPGASVQVDAQRHRITLTWPAAALGPLARRPGLLLYLNTWDWDGGYRAHLPQAASHSMGGAPGVKVMDELGPLRLP
jgi:hypothetical protein